MMLEVILLEFSPVCGQSLVVEEVMGHVVADVTENTAAEDSSGNGPVPVEDGVGQLPERRGKCEEECGWHNKSQPIHR